MNQRKHQQLVKKRMEPPSLPSHSALLLSVLLQLLQWVAAQEYRNMTIGSTLNPLGPISSFSSPSGHFAFGFWPAPEVDNSTSSLFLLAIWYMKTTPQPVVWFAATTTNHKPALLPAQSSLQLTEYGILTLTNDTGSEVWNPGQKNITHVALLDTGNLVLYDSSDSQLWESFGYPTDTLLPGMVLPLGWGLWSKLTDMDFSSGRFSLVAEKLGSLVLYPLAVPVGNEYDAIWSSNTTSGTQLVFNTSGALYYEVSNGSNVNLTSTSAPSTVDYFHRATLDPDGNFRVYTSPKNATGGKWTIIKELLTDGCRMLSDYGSGACGFNAYCNSSSRQQQLDCECPPRYEWLDPSRKYKGCMPNFVAQRCDVDESRMFGFEELVNADWPKSGASEHYTPVDEATCRKLCLEDCFCAVAVFRGSDCWKKKMPMSSGQLGGYVGGKALIKVPKSNASLPPAPPSPSPKERRTSNLIIVGAVMLGVAGVLLILMPLHYFRAHRHRSAPKVQKDWSMLDQNLRAFTYKELEDATNGFREEVGSGAFGTVYKGTLAPEATIAVKKLDRLSKDAEREFTNEVRSIGRTHHKNLVRLLGFCHEGPHRMLVYEYMCNGSVTSSLLSGTRPSWSQRANIALGVARGLLYLHEECSSPIIHCDIKPQNVLLDEGLVPKISDFGLAKLLHANQTRTNTFIRGTRGYVAPEWFKNSAVTAKVDVYSFGVLLLEVVCCRRCIEQELLDEHEAVLVYWADDCFRSKKVEHLVEGDEEAMADIARVERFVRVAIWCIQEDPTMRPSMNKVVHMLQGDDTVPIPPVPSSSASLVL